MQYYFDENKNLVITADEEEQRMLREYKSELEDQGLNFSSNDALYETFESLICNSELEFSDASTINALTSAPVLAIFSGEDIEVDPPCEENNYRCIGYRVTGGNHGVTYGIKLWRAWAFMDYAVRSPQEDLLEYGQTVFQLGWDTEETESTDGAVDE